MFICTWAIFVLLFHIIKAYISKKSGCGLFIFYTIVVAFFVKFINSILFSNSWNNVAIAGQWL